MTTDPTPAEQYMHCPFCPRVDQVSDEDPDASFSEMLGHIRYRHYDEDQTPAVLWPKIEIKAGDAMDAARGTIRRGALRAAVRLARGQHTQDGAR